MRRRVPSFRDRGRRAGALLVALLATIGCSRPETAADRHAKELGEAISKLQAEQDRFDRRLGELEVAVAEEKSPTRPPEARASAGETKTPPLRVVQLGAPEEPAPDPDEATQRPEIRVAGGGGGLRAPSGGRDGQRPVLDPDARRAYESALGLVQAKQYDRGLDALSAFLVKWPDHPFVENAMYWRGEALFGKGEYARAIEQFEAVLARYGAGKKAPDALLKLGMCHDRLGARDRAKEHWDRLRVDYPRSEAARKAPALGRGASAARSDEERAPIAPKGPKENR